MNTPEPPQPSSAEHTSPEHVAEFAGHPVETPQDKHEETPAALAHPAETGGEAATEQTFEESVAEIQAAGKAAELGHSGEGEKMGMKFGKVSPKTLLALHPSAHGGPGETLAHHLALHGFLKKTIARLLRATTKGEEASAAAHAALVKALHTAGTALPVERFPGKTLNVLGELAAGGHLADVPDTVFTREVLLHLPPTDGLHFLEAAKLSDRLREVPAYLWKRIQRFQGGELSEAESALLKVLLEFHDEVVAHYCALLEANPNIYHRDIPPDLKTEPALRAIQRAHELKHYEQNPIPFEHLPQRFQEGADALHAWSRPWIRLLASEPFSFDKIPPQLRESAEAVEAWAKPWLAKLAGEPMAFYQIPPQLRNAPEALAARKHYHCGAVSEGNEAALRGVPSELREDPEVREAMLHGWVKWFGQKGLEHWESIPENFRTQQELVEKAAALWMERIQRTDVKWPDIHEEVRALSKVREVWLGRQKFPVQMGPSFAEVAAHPNITKTTLDLWRHSNHWNRQRALGCLVELRGAPWHYTHLDEAARQHPMIEEAAFGGITELVRRHWSYLQVAPPDFQTEPDLLDLAATEWLAALKAGQISWERLPHDLHQAPSLVSWKKKLEATERKEAREQKQAAIQGKVRLKPQIGDEELTAKELKNAGIRKLRSTYWAKRIAEDRMTYLEVPQSLLDLEIVQNAMRKQWGPIVRQNPAIFDELPERVRADEGIQRVHRIATRPDTEEETPKHAGETSGSTNPAVEDHHTQSPEEPREHLPETHTASEQASEQASGETAPH